MTKGLFEDAKDEEQVLAWLAGFASMCWDDPGKAGRFHAESALNAVREAQQRLTELRKN